MSRGGEIICLHCYIYCHVLQSPANRRLSTIGHYSFFYFILLFFHLEDLRIYFDILVILFHYFVYVFFGATRIGYTFWLSLSHEI